MYDPRHPLILYILYQGREYLELIAVLLCFVRVFVKISSCSDLFRFVGLFTYFVCSLHNDPLLHKHTLQSTQYVLYSTLNEVFTCFIM